MPVQENTVERELHVAPCLECGATDIRLNECNDAFLYRAGGRCEACGHKTLRIYDHPPSREELAAAWNAFNDIPCLIHAERINILKANLHIAILMERLVPAFILLETPGQKKGLMPAEDFLQREHNGVRLSNEGFGVWATATHRSDMSTCVPRPPWATHVVWYEL